MKGLEEKAKPHCPQLHLDNLSIYRGSLHGSMRVSFEDLKQNGQLFELPHNTPRRQAQERARLGVVST